MTGGLAQNATVGINRWRAVTTPEGKNIAGDRGVPDFAERRN